MSRADNFHGKPGPGRPKGARNKITQEARDLAGKFLTDTEYQTSVQQRLNSWEGSPP